MDKGEFRSLRESLGLSQQKMADLLGVSYATVQGWESGRRGISRLTGKGIEAVVAEYRRGEQKAA